MVYIILGKGFEPMEAIAPCDILRRGGAEVRFAGIGGTLIEGGHGISVQADCTVEQMKLADTDMVLLPGGLGGVHSILDLSWRFCNPGSRCIFYCISVCKQAG